MNTSTALLQPEIDGLKHVNSGKVREMYDLGDQLLLVTSDRISAFDVVLPQGIPNKGKVLNLISDFWFRKFGDITAHHCITTNVDEMPDDVRKHADILRGRTTLAKKAKPMAIECIVRGYLIGSGWKDYQKTGAVCGIKLPEGLQQAQKLPEAIFTPSTKAEEGHDENISFDQAADIVGREKAEELSRRSIELYTRAADYALTKGIVLADTKFEFGEIDGELILIDEVLTPDSSRYWPQDQYQVGMSPPSFDKQFVRDYLETLDWDKKYPAPDLPEEVVTKTAEKYTEAYRRLTGEELPD